MRVFISMKKCLSRSTIHSKVETLSSPTAAAKRSASSSIACRVLISWLSTLDSMSRPSLTAVVNALSKSSAVTETSNSFCSCICSEQSRPPSASVHSPLPKTCISWWRVVSMFNSIRMFLFSPAPVAFTSLRISSTNEGANSDTFAN